MLVLNNLGAGIFLATRLDAAAFIVGGEAIDFEGGASICCTETVFAFAFGRCKIERDREMALRGRTACAILAGTHRNAMRNDQILLLRMPSDKMASS